MQAILDEPSSDEKDAVDVAWDEALLEVVSDRLLVI